jgi:hypothetical protein
VIVDITIEQLRSLPSYAALTARQQHAVEVFLSTGNSTQAILESYTARNAQTMRYKVFQSPRVLAALAEAGFVGPVQHVSSPRKPRQIGEAKSKPNRETFDARLQRAISNPNITVEQVQSLRAEAEAHGYFQPEVSHVVSI